VGALYQGVDNSVYTNAAAASACDFAARISKSLGTHEDLIPEWKEFSSKLTILTANNSEGGIYHPEYEGFPSKNVWSKGKVKQADVVLLGFPLDVSISRDERRNDLAFYEPLYAPNGPAMTESMHALAYLELDDPQTAEIWFNKTM